ncbi:glutaredoxin family protein [Fundicoccus culcitae]|uniref:Glutaredoxin domain-containing protein n=1 Tax=Fundicoccus culcitae TaxID=2969821 RepID=A0ABY5P445_9LACT|nr:glutaredoxin domain-containing protein [Fundicoccus culcitae]UUX33462.1 hypothetical protein NRE15_11210 [Fundicoccus culcitae]
MNDITIYTTPTCPYCNMMKTFLINNDLPFKEVDVTFNPVAMFRLVKQTGKLTVPQTNINGEWVIGYDLQKTLSLVKY